MTTKEMRVLYENGRTVDELAKEAGICPSSVIGRFRRIGFRLRTAIFTRIKAAPNLDHLSFVDRSYLAGLIDGEGCIGLHWDINTGTFRPYVTITNTNKPVLQWAKRTLGIGFISMNERKNLGYKNAYKIEFKRLAEIPALLYSILPFIKIKRKQTLALAMFCERRIERAKNGKGYSRGDHKLYRLLKRLNQKGVA